MSIYTCKGISVMDLLRIRAPRTHRRRHRRARFVLGCCARAQGQRAASALRSRLRARDDRAARRHARHRHRKRAGRRPDARRLQCLRVADLGGVGVDGVEFHRPPRRSRALLGWPYKLICFALGGYGLFLLSMVPKMGIAARMAMVTAFAVLGLSIAGAMAWRLMRGADHARWWLSEHLTAMGINFAATHGRHRSRSSR